MRRCNNPDVINFNGIDAMIAVSIVSHGHGSMVERLVKQLEHYPEVKQIILTLNIEEQINLQSNGKLEILSNRTPLGFGANHNKAFYHCRMPLFCVLNPDIELLDNPFPILQSCLAAHDAAIVSPLVLSPTGQIEDSIRYFPTLGSLIAKAIGRNKGHYAVTRGQAAFYPEWVAGMFMLFSSAAFLRMGGFDDKFTLYYEDVDICVRLWKEALPVVACPRTQVIHAAQRESHRNLRYMRWHITSMMRYFYKHFGRLPHIRHA